MFKKPKKLRKISRKLEQKTPHLLRGMKDILPEEQKYWSFILEKGEKLVQAYGFEKIDPPILEETSLFRRAIGEETDIVEKEMFTFRDQGGEEITLRPEMTASIARAYIEHGMINRPQPLKFYSFGPVFRYGRPQAGRFRQFHQFNLEILGAKNPVIDAQIILISSLFFQEIGLEISIQINSLGCLTCRQNYKKTLLSFYRDKKNFVCSSCQGRLIKNPLRLLDCKEKNCQRLMYEVPQIVDFLCEDCKTHFIKVLEFLDDLEVPYNLNPCLVRGLDYYNRTVFEIWPVGLEEVLISPQISLGGGGRYDQLIEILGGQETAACGVGFGLERIILEMKRMGIIVPEKEKPEVFLAQLGEQAKKKALRVFEDLRKKKIKVAENFSKDSLRAQLEMANKLGTKFSLILGQKEALDNTILIRDMENGAQETIDFDKTILEIKKRLKEKEKAREINL